MVFKNFNFLFWIFLKENYFGEKCFLNSANVPRQSPKVPNSQKMKPSTGNQMSHSGRSVIALWLLNYHRHPTLEVRLIAPKLSWTKCDTASSRPAWNWQDVSLTQSAARIDGSVVTLIPRFSSHAIPLQMQMSWGKGLQPPFLDFELSTTRLMNNFSKRAIDLSIEKALPIYLTNEQVQNRNQAALQQFITREATIFNIYATTLSF